MIKKAFTLIELLVVVAIIGILAAVGTPIFQGFIEDAKEAQVKQVCSNVRSDIESALFYCSFNPVKNLPFATGAGSPACSTTWTVANYVYQKHAVESQWIPPARLNPGSSEKNGTALVGFSKRNTAGSYPDGGDLARSRFNAVGIRVVGIKNNKTLSPAYIELSCKDMFNDPHKIQMWEIFSP
jgi:prepilin-type N-terminal cleavage/methylation domain-containing protein